MSDKYRTIHKNHQVLGVSGAAYTAKDYIGTILRGEYVKASGRNKTNRAAGSSMYAHDYLKSAIVAKNNEGEKTPAGKGYKKSQIDYYLYMKICVHEAKRVSYWGSKGNGQTEKEVWDFAQDHSILTKYSEYTGVDEWESFSPVWHLRWQMEMFQDIIVPDFNAWNKAGQPYSWDPRVDEEEIQAGTQEMILYLSIAAFMVEWIYHQIRAN